jgi:hypothetical protein
MSSLIMFALVGDIKLLFVLAFAFDDEFNAKVDEDNAVVRFVPAVPDVKEVVVIVVAVVADEADDENEPLFAPVFTN